MASFYAEFGHISEGVRGVIVALILLTSAMSGIFAGNISDKLSRKRAISLGAFIFSVGQVISCVSFKYIGILALGRLIAGAGEGIFLGTLNVYVSEISPKHLRGMMMLLTQTFICLGVTSGFFVVYGAQHLLHPANVAWRIPFAISAGISLGVGIAAPFLPYSPRWLLAHNRRREAEEVIDKLVGTGEHAQQERRELLAAGPAAMADKGAERSKRAAFKRIWQKDVRWRTILGALMNSFQMLSGIDFVLFFAPLLFTQAGLDPATASFIASGVTGILLIASTFVTTLFIGKVGRRTIFIGGGLSIASTLFVLGIMYASGGAKGRIGKWVTVVFIELFAFTFGCTWASCTRLIATEIQPGSTRAAAASFAQASNQLINFVVAVSGPVFLARSSYGPYFTYGAFTLAGTLFAYFFQVETKGQSLESIDALFTSTSIPLAVPLPSFLTGSSSPLASARLAVTDKVKEHRQRRASRAGSQSLGVDGEGAPGIRLRRASSRGRHNSSALADAEAGGKLDGVEELDEEGKPVVSEDPRAAFRREMMAANTLPTLPRMDSAIE
ncbi:hypothetical protein JCM8097_009275 [Rhodosporidiobolus ruineniae]